jgi:hypothetical protein
LPCFSQAKSCFSALPFLSKYVVKGVVSSVRAVPVNNKEKIEDVILDSSYPLIESYPGPPNKCGFTVQLYPPYVHAYRTTPNALTTTVKGITSDNTSHPPTKISQMAIINWLVQMTSQPNLIVSLPWSQSSTL